MAVFESDQQLYSVLQSVFDRLAAEPRNADKLAKTNLVLRMNFTDPAAQVMLDGRHPATEVFYGPTPGKANMEFSMSADLLHHIWMGDMSTSQAFFSGQIKTKGNFMKAMQLIELFRECERVYPAVAAEYDLQ
ncbi:MAG: SCP2 sterol-binding domain-containing protein [Caldilineaceae bacterium]|jgi:putative sterol carrier protein